MKKRFLVSLSAIVLGVSSSVAMAEPCPPNASCQDNRQNQSQHQQVQQHSQQGQSQDQKSNQKQSHQPQQQQSQQQYKQQSQQQQRQQQPQQSNAKAQGKQSQGYAQNSQAHGNQHRAVRVDSARLRSGPGTGYPVVKGLKKGEKVEVIKVQDDWAQVQIGTTLLWVAASLLTSN